MNEEWRGLQDGEVVFGVSGPKDTVMGEVVRYARTYAPDGEVTLQLKQGRKWVSALTMDGDYIGPG